MPFVHQPNQQRQHAVIIQISEIKDENKIIDSLGHGQSYSCIVCQYKTNDKANFEEHLRKHVKIKQFKCCTCSTLFKTRDEAGVHAKTHILKREISHEPKEQIAVNINQNPNHKCDHCEMKFETVQHKDNHLNEICEFNPAKKRKLNETEEGPSAAKIIKTDHIDDFNGFLEWIGEIERKIDLAGVAIEDINELRKQIDSLKVS